MQRLDLSTINIIDVETTCWEHSPPADQEQEITIVAVLLRSGRRTAG